MEPIVGKTYRTIKTITNGFNIQPMYYDQEFTVLEIHPKEPFLKDHIKIQFTNPEVRSKDGWNSIVKSEWYYSVAHPIEPIREVPKLSFV